MVPLKRRATTGGTIAMVGYRYDLRPALLALALATAALGGASAQSFPTGNVRLIVPVPAGGVTDSMARVVAQGLSQAWGQSVIVDNRPGGNYSVGVQAVARAPADGHTLLVVPDSTVTANPLLFSKLSYDPAKDLAPIIALCRITPMMVVNASVPAKTVQDLIALAKAKPGILNYGSYGVGTYAHLSMEDFKQRTGTDIVHIPYRGASPAITGLLAGNVSMLLLNLSSIEGHEKVGKARILAAAGEKRASARPDLPTVAEAGVPGFATTAWFGLFGPAGLPPDLVARIHADVAKVLDSPQVKQFFEKNSFERIDRSPKEFAQLIQDDQKHWGALIKSLGLKLD
jgi:tripartite-type tricarboxylate transporter receptor subunit TctC